MTGSGCRVEERGESFQIVSPAGRVLAYIYFEDRDQVSCLSPRMKRAQAERFAQNVADSPGILDGVAAAKG